MLTLIKIKGGNLFGVRHDLTLRSSQLSTASKCYYFMINRFSCLTHIGSPFVKHFSIKTTL